MYSTFCVSRETADRFIKLFVNRRAYGMQAAHPCPMVGSVLYLARDWQTKKQNSRRRRGAHAPERRHHINLYAIIRRRSARSGAIDADFEALSRPFPIALGLKQDASRPRSNNLAAAAIWDLRGDATLGGGVPHLYL